LRKNCNFQINVYHTEQTVVFIWKRCVHSNHSFPCKNTSQTFLLRPTNLAGLNRVRSTMIACPSTTSSDIAAPEEGPLIKIPQQLCPVATQPPFTPGISPFTGILSSVHGKKHACSAFNRASPSAKWLDTILATLFSTCGSPTICSESSGTSTPDDIPHDYSSPINQFSYFTANIRFWETVWLAFWHDCLVFALE